MLKAFLEDPSIDCDSDKKCKAAECDACRRQSTQLNGGYIVINSHHGWNILCNDCAQLFERIQRLLYVSKQDGTFETVYKKTSNEGDEQGFFEHAILSNTDLKLDRQPFQVANAAVREARPHANIPMYLAVICVLSGRLIPYVRMEKMSDDNTIAQNRTMMLQEKRKLGLRPIELYDGDGMIICKMFVHAKLLSKQDHRWACIQCKETFQKKHLKHCARCKVTWYCSRTCQKAHWKIHVDECVPFDNPTTKK